MTLFFGSVHSRISCRNSFGALVRAEAAYQQIALGSSKFATFTSVAKEKTWVLERDVTRSLRILT